jgi:hypothetical protein
MVLVSRYASSRFDHFVAFDQDNWNADMRDGSVVGGIAVLAIIGGYMYAVLAMTSRRRPVPPTTLFIGGVTGLAIGVVCYALTPFGGPLTTGLSFVTYPALLAIAIGGPWLAGFLAGRRSSTVDGTTPTGQGVLAGLLAGGAAAIVVGVLTVSTMVSYPERVELRWANPDPSAPHGTQYELQMSVGDASTKYEAFLLLGPLIGLVLGGLGGTRLAGDAPQTQPVEAVRSPAPTRG